MSNLFLLMTLKPGVTVVLHPETQGMMGKPRLLSDEELNDLEVVST